MIVIKDKREIEIMKDAGQRLADLFLCVEPRIQSGISTLELDKLIEEELKQRDLVSQAKGYMGYQYVSCISLNEEVVHGIPSAKRVLTVGDLVKIDICAKHNGYCADMTRMFYLGLPKPEVAQFIKVAHSALDKGIDKARAGNRLSDISAAIQREVELNGYGVVRDFAGHGIGRSMHEDPEILNFGEPGKGPVLRSGMTLAIEPMITMGHYKISIADDKWTVRTVDKSLAAHVEDTIVVTEGGPCVLTRKEISSKGV